MVKQRHTACQKIFHRFLLNLTNLFFMPPAVNLTVNEQLTGPHTAGLNSILPKEHGSQFFYLPIIRHSDEEVSNAFGFTALLWLQGISNCVSLDSVTLRECALYSCNLKNASRVVCQVTASAVTLYVESITFSLCFFFNNVLSAVSPRLHVLV